MACSSHILKVGTHNCTEHDMFPADLSASRLCIAQWDRLPTAKPVLSPGRHAGPGTARHLSLRPSAGLRRPVWRHAPAHVHQRKPAVGHVYPKPHWESGCQCFPSSRYPGQDRYLVYSAGPERPHRGLLPVRSCRHEFAAVRPRLTCMLQAALLLCQCRRSWPGGQRLDQRRQGARPRFCL